MRRPRSFRRVVALAAAAAVAAACSGSSGSAPRPSSEWWRDVTFYEVFVRSFADSDGDGTGDLAGLAARLDYLNDGDPATTTDLGVGALWLMPISASPSYHGYDVTDYRAVEPDYGTLADLDALVAAAHRRGIKVVVDMVLNHSSSSHPWFLDSRAGPIAARRDWYVWSATSPGWTWDGRSVWHASGGAYYYGFFWSGMPDLNLGNPAVEQELVDAMRFWLARGVDGFRLDAVRHYVENGAGADSVDQPESHALIRRVRAALQAEYPDVLLVAEAWTSVERVATYWGAGDEAHLAFSFEVAAAVPNGLVAGDASPVVNALARSEVALAGKDRGFEAPFLTNHDQVRVMRALGGDAARARAAAATLLALPGTPFLYYGEEIGMQGGAAQDDREKRTPFHWTGSAPGYGFTTGTPWYANTAEAAGVDVEAQRVDEGSLWQLYRRLIALRRTQPALTRGEAVRPAVTGGGTAVLALLRSNASGRVLFVANYSTEPVGPFTVAVAGTPAVLLAEGLAGAPAAAAGAVQVSGLAPRGFAFISVP